MRKQPFTEDEFKQIYSRVPRVTTDAVIIHKDGLILVKRNHESWNNMWTTPGGTVLYQETIEETVRRIVQEEIGITITIERYLGHAEYFEIEERGFGHSVSLNFLCTTSQQAPAVNEEGESICTFSEMPAEIVKEQKPFIEMGLEEWRRRG